MVCGGVEKELLTIINRFDPKEYELSVLLFYSQDKEMEDQIPSNVRLINLEINSKYYCGSFREIILGRIIKGKLFEGCKIAVERLCKGVPTPVNISIDSFFAPDEIYDFAVCYHMHSPLVLKYVAEKIKARVKYAWIHNDFLTTGFKVNKYDKWLKIYDSFYGVSNQLTEEFKIVCPQYREKVYTCHNIVDVENIKRKSYDLSCVEKSYINCDVFKIVTVGRFVEQKGFDLAIKAAAIMKARGVRFRWYAIGYGQYEETMKSLIEREEIEDCFVILGRKENPYPFMRLADLYVQPSRHEGYPLTLAEAVVLKKCIVSTKFCGASEQIENHVTGIIVEDFSPQKISEAIIPFINSEEYKKKFLYRIYSTDYSDGWESIQEVFT